MIIEAVLSQAEKDECVAKAHDRDGAPCFYELADCVEQAVLARLAEQEPVAWTSSKIFGHYVTHDTKATAAEWFKESLDVPLYAHPCVSPTSEKPACVSENGESETQTADNLALEYRLFTDWCRANPSFDLDSRLHTHSGPIGKGGYISDEKTRIAFAAWKAARGISE